MNEKAIEKTELNKILSIAAEYSVLDGSKEKMRALQPSSDLSEVKKCLDLTEECVKLLFTYGVGKVEYFPPFSDEIERAEKGSALSCGELLSVANLLRAARIAHSGISGVSDEEIRLIRRLSDNLYFDAALEDDIGTKILNDSEVSDYASDKLHSSGNPASERKNPLPIGGIFNGGGRKVLAGRYYYDARQPLCSSRPRRI